MKISYLFLLFFIGISCSDNTDQQPTVPAKKKVSEQIKNKASWNVFHTPDIGWGYRIFRGAKLIIDQQHIPAVPGIKGFDSRSKAEQTAQYIMQLVAAGNDRPSVSTKELDSIGVINLEDYTIPKARTDVQKTIREIGD
jgi:hypothetical protein